MKTKIKTWLGAVIIIIVAITAGIFVWKIYSLNPISDSTPQVKMNLKNKSISGNSQIANPASVYCKENGGELEIRTGENGGQVGYCKFSDGSECEEWQYQRGECKIGDSQKQVDTSDWQTYQNKEYGFEVKYPNGMNIEKAMLVVVTSEKEIKKRIADMIKSDMCPSICATYKEDNNLLNEQFEILSKIKSCPYNEELINEIKKSYALFHHAHGGNEIAESITNQNISCILKTVAIDGFDVSLDNIYYYADFLKNDSIIHIEFPVYPRGVFAETDVYYKGLGYDDGSCDAKCTERETEAFDNYLNNPVALKNISTYDQILSTFKFIN